MRLKTARLAFRSVAGPVILLAVVIGFSVVAGMQGVSAGDIGAVVAGQGSAILCVASLIFATLALGLLPIPETWRLRPPFVSDALLGGILGFLVALSYL